MDDEMDKACQTVGKFLKKKGRLLGFREYSP